jgi:hypothetical protein
VTIAAHDDLGRERLSRYGARPPFSLAKLRVLKDGNVSYLVKKVGRGRVKRRVKDEAALPQPSYSDPSRPLSPGRVDAVAAAVR